MQDVAVEEGDGAEGLVLGGGRDIAVCGEVDDELLYFGDAHFAGVFFVVEEDVAANPVDIGFFGALGVVFSADGVADLFEELFFVGLVIGDSLHVDLYGGWSI